MKILNINFQSICNKIPNLRELIHTQHPDIIIGTETWLTPDVTNNEIIPPDLSYIIYRKDRCDGYGGIMIAIAQSLAPSEILLPSISCETLWIQFKAFNDHQYLVGAFYRPNAAACTPLEELDMSLYILQEKFKNATIWLAGDFNAPGIRWSDITLSENVNCSFAHNCLIDIVHDHGLHQLVTSPTRGNNILDLFLTNDPSTVMNIKILPGISDHEIVSTVTTLVPKILKQSRRKIYLYNKAQWEVIRRELDLMIAPLLSCNDVDDIWESFKKCCLSLRDKYIPCKIAKSRCSLPWITNNIRKLLKVRNTLYHQYKQTRSIEIYQQFKEAKHWVQKEMRTAYFNYINGIISSNVSSHTPSCNKKFWSFVKHLKKDNVTIPTLLDKGDEVSDNLDKAEVLNRHFRSVFTEEPIALVLPDKGPSPHPDIHHFIIDEDGVFKLISTLNIHKACGPDQINAIFLRQTSSIITPLITKLFQMSVDSGKIPNDWRTAYISPIFKKGDPKIASNYRPVSLTSITCKILEHILASNIMRHLEGNNILYELQHGFRESKSCETQLISLLHDLAQNLDHGVQTDLISLDFAKAFDTVPHSRLLYKLNWYGIRGNIHTWISSFLANRTQSVVVNNAISSNVSVTSGVPQGTVLGPVLFLIFINDLPDDIKNSMVRLFADDCILYRSIHTSNDCIKLQGDLCKLEQWEKTWLMKFNPTKCCVMTVSLATKHKILHSYVLHETPLLVVDKLKYLGVILQNNLKWDYHVSAIISKASQTLGFLRRNFKTAPQNIRELAYCALVRPQVEYAASAWSPWLYRDIIRLEGLQRRGARFVSRNYQRMASVSNMIGSLGWETLEDRRKKFRVQMLYKIVYNMVMISPTPVSIMEPSYYNLRYFNNQRIYPPYCRTDTYKYSFFPHAIQLWNNLPQEITSSPSFVTFKKLLHKYTV